MQRTASGTPVVVQHVTSRGPRYEFRCPVCKRRFPRFRPISRDAALEYLDATSSLPDVFFFDRVSAGSIALAEAFRDADRLVVFEPSMPGRPDLFTKAIHLSHIVKFADDRMRGFSDALPRRRVRQIRIVTMGASGCRLHFVGAPVRQSAIEMEVVDSAGAGDWTTAGLLRALPKLAIDELTKDELESAVRFGQALAALSCRFVGARGLARSIPADVAVELATQATRASVDGSIGLDTGATVDGGSHLAPACQSAEGCMLVA